MQNELRAACRTVSQGTRSRLAVELGDVLVVLEA